ncbi:putative DMT superfamily transporter inner membrane protein [Caballeronia hypogeia]|uniref:DMT superfamily transporter inner membrane protein n=1 Tax=Caballeronia hypogeia TaxID=1777140 RepID=A0A158CLG4_9BURK|nr:DMT family transporter [Caballeronia hypogeia]SAK83185.1 putative DMT superfamily transporter inner membrane protein [Caballeronia hypogeia]
MLFFVTDFAGMERLLQDWRATAGVVVGLGTLLTGAAFLIYYYLLEKLGAVASSSSNYLAPAVALLIGWAVGERFGLPETVAMVLIFGSIALLQIGQQRASGESRMSRRVSGDGVRAAEGS